MSSVEQLPLLLEQVQSGDNQVRMLAEHKLYTDWLDAGGDRPAQLLLGLAQIAAYGDEAVRPSAAVILRRCATRAAFNASSLIRVVDQIDPNTRNQIRDVVLQGMLSPEQQPFTRHKLADAVAELARPSERDPKLTEWPGLLETIANAATTSEVASIRETTYRILGSVPELIGNNEDMVKGAVELLLRGFEDSNEQVRTTSTSAFSAFFVCLPKKTWAMFKPLLPVLLNVMEPFRQNHLETELTSVLESLITLAEVAPKMFLPVFGTLIDFTLAVASEQDFDENTRMSALELMATFADGAPNMCKREPKYVAQLVPVLLKLLTEVGVDDEDSLEWQNTDDTMLIEEEEAIHSESKLVMDRISLSLGGEAVIPPLFQYLPTMFVSNEWRERFAALMALSNAAEGCRDQMLQDLGTILSCVKPLLDDPHPRVQWGACNAMGQLSTDLAPEIQDHFATLVLPGLISKLSSDSTFKVQAHAAAALVNFSDAADSDVMDPYLDDLLSRLVGLVQSPKRYVQEQALTTIAMVADSAQDLFTKYYDALMPLVINILTADVPVEYRLLKAKAIECATLIAFAVGKEKFLPNMSELGQILLKIQQESPDGVIMTENGEEDDPCHTYLAQSWGRLCRVVGTDFMPYLSAVLPSLLAAAKYQADCHLLDVDQAESLRDAEGWEVVRYSGQWLGVNTASFEDKANAIELLHVYPRELGAQFYSYVPQILNEIVIPGIKFFYNIHVRMYSCQLVAHLITCTQAHFGNQRDAPGVLEIWKPVLQTIIANVFENDRESAAMVSEALLTIQRAVELIGPSALEPEELNVCCQAMTEWLLSVKSRLLQYAADRNANADENDDDDEYAEDSDHEEEQDDENLVDASNKLIHALLKILVNQGSAGDVFSVNSPLKPILELVPQFAQTPNQDLNMWALEVITDVAEFCKQAGLPLIEAMSPFVMSSLNSANSSALVRANAANCIGRISLISSPQIAQWSIQALEPLFALTKIPNARSEENIEVTERCCGAIARILRTSGASSFSADQFSMAINEWLQTLPITSESDGASYAYLFLADLIEKKHPVVLNNYSAVFKAVVKALSARTLQGAPAEYTINHVKILIASLPEDKRMELLDGLSHKEKQVVQTVFV